MSALGEEPINETPKSEKAFKSISTQTEGTLKTNKAQKGGMNGLIGIAFGGAVAGFVFAGVYLGLKKFLKLK